MELDLPSSIMFSIEIQKKKKNSNRKYIPSLVIAYCIHKIKKLKKLTKVLKLNHYVKNKNIKIDLPKYVM